MKTISVGSRVILMSGGPVMTVEKISADIVHVVWFGNDNQIYRSPFNIACVRIAPQL